MRENLQPRESVRSRYARGIYLRTLECIAEIFGFSFKDARTRGDVCVRACTRAREDEYSENLMYWIVFLVKSAYWIVFVVVFVLLSYNAVRVQSARTDRSPSELVL